MKRFLLFVWFVAASLFCNAATITGPIYLTYSNRPYTGPILIRPLSTPLPYTPNLVTGGDFKVSPDTNGLFSVDLQPGNYRVTIGADRPFTIDVPTNAATYTLLERITNALSWNSSILPFTNTYAIALTTRSGTVKASSDQGDPIAWLTNETATIGARIGQLTFATVDDMIAAAVPAYNNVGVYCLGRNTANDGGGGPFVWNSSSTSTTNMGSVLKNNSTSTGRYLAITDQGKMDVRRFGAKADGSTDSAAAINDALLWGARNGVTITTFGGGTIRTASRLILHDNSSFVGDGETTIAADYSGSTSDMYYSILSNTNLFTGIGSEPRTSVAALATNIYLSKLKLTALNSSCNARGLVLIAVHDTVVEDVEVVRTYGTWAFTFYAKNLRTRGLKVSENNELFEDGIHILGGEQQSHVGFNIKSGDDALAIGWDSSDVYAKDITFADGTVESQKAFAIKIFSPSVATVPIERIVYSGIVGKGGNDRNGALMFHEHGTPSGRITNVTVKGVSLAAAQGTHGGTNPYGLWVIGGTDLRFDNVSVAGADQYQVIVDGQKGPISFSNCNFQTPDTSIETVFVQNGYGNLIEFNGCRIVNNTQRAIRIIETDLSIRGSSIVSGTSMHVGFQFGTNNTRSISMQNNWLSGASTVPVQMTGTGTKAQRFVFNGNVMANTSSTIAIDPGSYYSAVGNSGLSTQADSLIRLDVATLNSTNFAAIGTMTFSNTAPILEMVASNGSSGGRLNVTGSSSILFRLQESGTTRYNFGSGTDRGITLSATGGETSAPDSYIKGALSSGTDASGTDFLVYAGSGTGNSTTKGEFKVNTPDATTSGTTSQSTSTKFRVKREGAVSFYNRTSDPTVNVADGDTYYKSDTDKLRLRANSAWENLATETYVTAAISGSGALTDGDKTDITVSSTGTVFTIDNSAVTYSKMQNVSATSRLLGRNASTTGPPEEITLGSGLSMSGTTLSVTGGGTGDVVGPASATDNAIARFDLTTGKLIQNSAATIADTTGDITAGKYNGVTISGSSTPTLAVTGTTTVSGANTGDQTITLTGDVTGSGTGSFSATIANSAVSNAKMANMTASTIKARVTGSTGAPEDATLSQVLDLVGSAAQGDILYRGASTWTRLGAGTTGQFLKTQGTGANPLWASVPGGGDALVANPLSQFAATTSLQLAGVISDETGSGALVFGTSPTLTTPTLGVATATTINKVALTAPATGATLTIADGKTLTANNTLTFTGTDGSTLNVGTGGTLGTAAYTASSAYQATDAEITALAGLTSAADKVPYFTGSGTASTADFTASGRTVVGQSSVKAVFDAINGAEATVASATTTDIGAASSDKVSITGTTTITGFGTATAGIKRSGRFTGALTLTHNATSLILPGGANITTVAGDRFEAVSLGAGNWVVYNYQTATWQGTGAEVHATSPTLTTPNIGVATATSVNKLAITAPATSATLTIADGKTATVNNSITFSGTDSTTMTFPSVSASIGYLGIPQGSKSADYTLVLADAGTHIFHPSSDANSRTFTIPANGSVAFPVGTAVTFYNASANSCTIAITTDTLRKAGTGTTGSVTLPQYAMATALKVTTTEWVISGNGI